MAENKREDWEIERDREEIARLLARFRRITHQRIASLLNARRKEDYKQALQDLNRLEADEAIPDVRPPYTLTRQMIDYDVKAIEREWKKRATENFDKAKARLLASAEELHETAWEDYEATKQPLDEIVDEKSKVDITTGVEEYFETDAEATEILFNRRGRKRFKVPAIKSKSKRKRTQQHGDSKLLLIVDRAQGRIEGLLGLAVAQEINLNTPGAAGVVLVAGFDPKKWDQNAAARTAAQEEKQGKEEAANAGDDEAKA